MYNITLVSTVHSERGKCNSEELYKIIEKLNPDVIFEEMCPDLYDRFYIKNEIPFETLETKAVRMYLLNHKIENIPIDIDPDTNISMQDIHHLFETFKKYKAYRKLDDEQCIKTESNGFTFLNSHEFMELSEEKKQLEIKLMEYMHTQIQLLRIYKLFHAEQENRESKWVHNIYDYSAKHKYKKAVFYCGASHRKSVIQKIQKYENEENFKINWNFYE